MKKIDGEDKVSNDDYNDVILYSIKLIDSLYKCGMKNTAKAVTDFMNEIIIDIELSLGE